MIRCQSFIQLLVHLGLVILLPGAVASAQAPLCSAVLESKEMSLEHIEESLKHLAEMKLQVDLTFARGKLTTIEKQRSNIFQNKLKDLVQHLQGQMSETQVKELLQNKINEIQGIKDIAQDLEHSYYNAFIFFFRCY
jgi:hydroxymethylpyrimidine pyrophosphatase-like HAD family hydrolase